MFELARPVGIGFAGRGKVSDVVRWADDARRRGLHSVWIHDTPYERDAVTYASAIAAQVPDIDIALGALSTNTRQPALIAMTISALDEMAPGRIRLGLGTTIPIRLSQMGIPYNPDAAVGQVSNAIDLLRTMWSGGRVPSATPNLPPIQPMFPPVHRVPIYVAAYRTAFLELAGQKADGYLSRPAESIPNLKRLVAKLRKASLAAGRDEHAVEVAGYLLTLVDKSRRAALNRAKREPFVIYMMSILSNFSLQQAGFDAELRDRIGAAWRAEDYHKAAELIPDEMLDAFMLCGTSEEVAEAAARYNEAGMDMPILQPILQEDEHIQPILEAAELYGSMAVKETVKSRTAVQESISLQTDSLDRLNIFEKAWRKFSAWTEIARPFSLTGAYTPVAIAGALAFAQGKFDLRLFIISLAATVLLQIGANIINEIYDVRNGVDSITSPRASQTLLKGRIKESEAFKLGIFIFGLASLLGIGMALVRGWPVIALGILGLIACYGYTAPPFQFKYKAAGIPLVFTLMGPLTVIGAYYVITGTWDVNALIVSIPIGLLITAVLHGNEWRDIADDARYGVGTFAAQIGRRGSFLAYVSFITAAFLSVVIAVLFRDLPVTSLLALFSLPLLIRSVQASAMGVNGQQRAIAKIDIETAQLHAVFGMLLVIGLALGGIHG
jgi:1,4-dihydroxy-2-naphthoate octaprenyltransferase